MAYQREENTIRIGGKNKNSVAKGNLKGNIALP